MTFPLSPLVTLLLLVAAVTFLIVGKVFVSNQLTPSHRHHHHVAISYSLKTTDDLSDF